MRGAHNGIAKSGMKAILWRRLLCQAPGEGTLFAFPKIVSESVDLILTTTSDIPVHPGCTPGVFAVFPEPYGAPPQIYRFAYAYLIIKRAVGKGWRKTNRLFCAFPQLFLVVPLLGSALNRFILAGNPGKDGKKSRPEKPGREPEKPRREDNEGLQRTRQVKKGGRSTKG